MDRTKLRGLGVLAALLVVAGLVVVLVNQHEKRAQEARVDRLIEQLTPAEVIYYVEGTADTVALTVQTPTGSEQVTTAVPVMNKAGSRGLRHNFAPGSFVYVSAQNQGGSGEVTCRIEVDGRIISENTSSGEYGIATCQGRS